MLKNLFLLHWPRCSPPALAYADQYFKQTSLCRSSKTPANSGKQMYVKLLRVVPRRGRQGNWPGRTFVEEAARPICRC